MTRAEFVEFVRAAKLGVVATVDAEGHPEAALVDLAVTDHGEVLFDTKATARKVVNIGGNQRVALVVGWADKVSVQAEGDAEVLWGAEREKYGRIHQEQVPSPAHSARTSRWSRWFRRGCATSTRAPSLSASSRPLWSSAPTWR